MDEEKNEEVINIGESVPVEVSEIPEEESNIENTQLTEENVPCDTIQRPVKCGWSWGAFSFGWLYGVFNKSWICLITLIPPVFSWLIGKSFPGFISIVLYVICGVLGEKMSYDNSCAEGQFDVKKWKQQQHGWDIAGIIFCVLSLIAFAFILGMGWALKTYIFLPFYS